MRKWLLMVFSCAACLFVGVSLGLEANVQKYYLTAFYAYLSSCSENTPYEMCVDKANNYVTVLKTLGEK